jgi:hypothetical protein
MAERDAVRAFHAAFEARDREQLARLVADDVEILNPLGNVVAAGREGALEWLRLNALDGVHVTPAGEPEVIGDEVRWPMTMRIAATGATLEAVGRFRVRNGRIARFAPEIKR